MGGETSKYKEIFGGRRLGTDVNHDAERAKRIRNGSKRIWSFPTLCRKSRHICHRNVINEQHFIISVRREKKGKKDRRGSVGIFKKESLLPFLSRELFDLIASVFSFSSPHPLSLSLLSSSSKSAFYVRTSIILRYDSTLDRE